MRKAALKDIFTAIEAEDFERAAQLCMARFGADLLLRLEKFSKAQTLFESVVAAKALPWAQLGVARSMLDAGETTRAATTLERLVSEEPGYADAYDVRGRFDRALDLYKMACQLTPHSITRRQTLGMARFYTGDRAEVEETLAQAVLIGLDSKLFDPQALVLLGFVRLMAGDRKGLKRCQADVEKLRKRNEGDTRYRRLAAVVDVLILLQDQQFARTLEAIRAMIRDIDDPDFDFESVTNLISLLAHGAETHNGKLIETAHLVLQRYAEKIKNLAQLQDAVQALRERYGTLHFKPVLPGAPKRQAGGLSLRMGT